MDQRLDAARHCARDVLTDRLAPVDAARRLASLALRPDDELTRFGELATAWDAAGPEERAVVEARILEEASMLVADTA